MSLMSNILCERKNTKFCFYDKAKGEFFNRCRTLFSENLHFGPLTFRFLQNADYKLSARHSDFLDMLLEVLTVADGSVLHTGPVVVDGVDGIVEELGNLAAVLNTETDEGEDADGRRELAFLEFFNAFFGAQQLIEISYEIREEMEEGAVEIDVQLFEFPVAEFLRTRDLVEFLKLTVLGELVDAFT